MNDSTGVNKATTKFDKWFVRQLIRSCNILSTATECANKETDSRSRIMDLQNLLTIHEEEILKHLTEDVD